MSTLSEQVIVGAEYELVKPVRDEHGITHDVVFGAYVVLCFSKDARTLQRHVVYRGLTGPDADQYLHCSFSDFLMRFRLRAAPGPAPSTGVIDVATLDAGE